MIVNSYFSNVKCYWLNSKRERLEPVKSTFVLWFILDSPSRGVGMGEAAAGWGGTLQAEAFWCFTGFWVHFGLHCTSLFREEHWDMKKYRGKKIFFGSPCQSGKLFAQAGLETASGLRMWGWMESSSPSCKIRCWTLCANPPGQWKPHQVSWGAPVEQNRGAVTSKSRNN